GSVMSMFIVQGALIGVLGTIAGTILGIILSLNVETIVPAIERFMNVDFLPADVYYISDLPSEMHTVDVIKISAGAFLLSLLSTIYPAVRAAHTHPAEALRYE
ncbi:MAG: FtsX-like permease family protein, partial [Gammaproteobacteria bacterium]|nr:FtsX-like permease family protein [Gammaproteobacteria bacterium]